MGVSLSVSTVPPVSLVATVAVASPAAPLYYPVAAIAVPAYQQQPAAILARHAAVTTSLLPPAVPVVIMQPNVADAAETVALGFTTARRWSLFSRRIASIVHWLGGPKPIEVEEVAVPGIEEPAALPIESPVPDRFVRQSLDLSSPPRDLQAYAAWLDRIVDGLGPIESLSRATERPGQR